VDLLQAIYEGNRSKSMVNNAKVRQVK